MVKLTYVLFGVALLLAACSTATPITSAPGENTSAVVSNDFHPSDVARLGTTGRPQLVEFFAYW